ncbi:MAG: hypothetical protein JWO36_928 [Myxococcales bacterium]|nr:hypothetical protein [Myxococcales bacterium]
MIALGYDARMRSLGLPFLLLAACTVDQQQPGSTGSGSDVIESGSGSASGSASGSGSGTLETAVGSAGELPHIVRHGALAFEILDDATGKRMPGKLTIIGVKGTHDPKLSKGDIGVEDETTLRAYNRVFSLVGTGDVEMPLGTYDVTFSRGIEWTISTHRITLRPEGMELRIRLKHVIDTPKWVSGDFHVHAASSPDSRVPMRDRVFEFVADGVDLIVSTDHNVISDYQPVIAELHAEKLLASATGDEITTGNWGHFGAFPLPHDTESEGGGAIPVRHKTPIEIFRSIRAIAPAAVIDVHHPRLEKGTGYFILGRFDDQHDTSTRKGFSYDFDALEVLNGYQDTNRRTIDRVMTDWFALLDRGHLITATGNSDTHHMNYNIGGYPRNYVRVENDDPGTVTAVDVARGVKAHHAYFTTGPIVDFTVGDIGIGDLAPAPDGKAKADITVRAAPWVSVSRVILYIAGQEAKRWDVPKSEMIERFHATYDIAVKNDTYAVIRVEGDKSLSPVVGDTHGVSVTPFALTNPIFLDANVNKAYDPVLAHGAHQSEEATVPVK